MQSRFDVQKSKGKGAPGKDATPAPAPHVQLKKAISGQEGFDAQSAALAPPGDWAPVQHKGGGGAPEDVHAAAAHGIASGGGALPHLDAIQQSFGKHDVSGVQAHTGQAAEQASQAMGAEAYATGDHVAFAGAPDMHTVAHEAAHVVQQRAGVSLEGGVGQSGDAYEQHADKVADAVVKGESAEGLLDQMAGGASGGATQSKAIQRKTVSGGPELAAVQEKLNKLGYDCGKPDGIIGPKTRAAIKAFQAAQGLVADGICGPQTLAALDAAAGGGGAAATTGATATTGGAGTTGASTDDTKKAQGDKTGAPPAAPPSGGTKETKAGDKTDTNTPPAKGGGQTDDLEKKKEETKGKEHVKPSPEEMAKKEAEFASEGKAAMSAVQGMGGPRLGGGGDTAGASVEGYPSWFGELQDYLVNSGSWSDTHESAQNVLYRYAMWKTECNLGYVPASVEFFFRYIGKSDGNNAAAKKAGKKGAEDLGGYGNAKNWCAQATTMAAEKSLKERGLKFKGGVAAWIQSSFGKAKGGSYWCTGCNGVDLGPGDSVSYLGKYHNNTTGHRVTVLENLGGGVFTHVSGNAGGGGSGSVRIATSKRSDVPKGWSPDRGMNQPTPKPTDDTVWVYSLQKTGDVFAELAKLDGVAPTDPRYDGLLTELRLQRI